MQIYVHKICKFRFHITIIDNLKTISFFAHILHEFYLLRTVFLLQSPKLLLLLLFYLLKKRKFMPFKMRFIYLRRSTFYFKLRKSKGIS